jgi:hypothetical protein
VVLANTVLNVGRPPGVATVMLTNPSLGCGPATESATGPHAHCCYCRPPTPTPPQRPWCTCWVLESLTHSADDGSTGMLGRAWKGSFSVSTVGGCCSGCVFAVVGVSILRDATSVVDLRAAARPVALRRARDGVCVCV